MSKKTNSQTITRLNKQDLFWLRKQKKILPNGRMESDADVMNRIFSTIRKRENELMRKANAFDIKVRFDKKNVRE